MFHCVCHRLWTQSKVHFQKYIEHSLWWQTTIATEIILTNYYYPKLRHTHTHKSISLTSSVACVYSERIRRTIFQIHSFKMVDDWNFNYKKVWNIHSIKRSALPWTIAISFRFIWSLISFSVLCVHVKPCHTNNYKGNQNHTNEKRLIHLASRVWGFQMSIQG